MEQKFQQTSLVDYSLKEGETLVLQLKNVSVSSFSFQLCPVTHATYWSTLIEFNLVAVNRKALKLSSPRFLRTTHQRKRPTKKSPWFVSNHHHLPPDHFHRLLVRSLPQTVPQISIFWGILTTKPQNQQKMIQKNQFLLEMKSLKIYQMMTLGIFRQLINMKYKLWDETCYTRLPEYVFCLWWFGVCDCLDFIYNKNLIDVVYIVTN